jgi:hypothetical protein
LAVSIRLRKPCTLFLRRLWGWNVLFLPGILFPLQINNYVSQQDTIPDVCERAAKVRYNFWFWFVLMSDFADFFWFDTAINQCQRGLRRSPYRRKRVNACQNQWYHQ